MAEKKIKTRDIGLNIKAPEESCEDKNCPFHGSLPVRGQVISGVVSSIKMQNSILVKKEFMHYVPKYERYERRSSKYTAFPNTCTGIIADIRRPVFRLYVAPFL